VSALHARRAELEKKWSGAAQLYLQAGLRVHAAVAFEKASTPARKASRLDPIDAPRFE